VVVCGGILGTVAADNMAYSLWPVGSRWQGSREFEQGPMMATKDNGFEQQAGSALPTCAWESQGRGLYAYVFGVAPCC
jgi:hypothetical protein